MDDWFSPERRRRLTLKEDRKRSIGNRHPWVFSGAIGRDEGPDEAAVADLVDRNGSRLASGFYSRHSQIRVRAVAFGEEELSADLLRTRIRNAVLARGTLLSESTSAVRLIHSEGDLLSGLVVDRYDDVLVVEISSAGLDLLRDLVVEALGQVSPFRSLKMKNDLPARKLEQLGSEERWVGDPVEEVEIREGGLRYRVALRDSQKTGFFLDQRDNRALARGMAQGRRVLNLFSYSGGFGVSAAAGGAAEVEEVDISAPAIAMARRNHELNPASARVSFTVADAFEHLRALVRESRRYDLVVCDPPAFAKSRGEVERAARGYKDVNLHALKLVAPGGFMLTFSCSGHVDGDLFQKIIFAAALDARREVSIVRRLGAGADHPVSIYCPEGEYLKGFLLRIG
jgi:23S rRNA (cytosine1962-C5)-methyltransferase